MSKCAGVLNISTAVICPWPVGRRSSRLSVEHGELVKHVQSNLRTFKKLEEIINVLENFTYSRVNLLMLSYFLLSSQPHVLVF